MKKEQGRRERPSLRANNVVYNVCALGQMWRWRAKTRALRRCHPSHSIVTTPHEQRNSSINVAN